MTVSNNRGFLRQAAMALAALLALGAPAALAQNAIPNPLRGRPVEKLQENATERAREKAEERSAETEAKPARRPRSQAKTDGEAKGDAKPKRERSAKQKENDEIMRACGASWRADKEALQGKGQTWRAYLKECRAKRKGEQKA